MSTENQTNPDNGRIYGAEVQHKISLAAMTSDDAVRARALLSSIGFNPEARANKVMLLINPDTVAAIQAAPQAVRDVLTNAGIGLNTHDSRLGDHVGYTKFVVGALNDLGQRADANGWDTKARSYAVYDFLRYLDQVNLGGDPPVYGTDAQTFSSGWGSFKAEDYGALAASNSGVDRAIKLDNYIAGLDLTPVDANSKSNSKFRYETIQKVLNEAQGGLCQVADAAASE